MHKPFKLFKKLLINSHLKTSHLHLLGLLILANSQKMPEMDGLSNRKSKIIKIKKFRKILKKKGKKNKNKVKR